MVRTIITEYNFPWNLLKDLNIDLDESHNDIPVDIVSSVEYCISRLPDNEKSIIRKKYIEGICSYAAISSELGISSSSVRSRYETAMRRLHHPMYRNIMIKGVMNLCNANQPEPTIDESDIMNQPITILDLDVRSRNALIRFYFNKHHQCNRVDTSTQIIPPVWWLITLYNSDQLVNVRNIGNKSIADIRKVLLDKNLI